MLKIVLSSLFALFVGSMGYAQTFSEELRSGVGYFGDIDLNYGRLPVSLDFSDLQQPNPILYMAASFRPCALTLSTVAESADSVTYIGTPMIAGRDCKDRHEIKVSRIASSRDVLISVSNINNSGGISGGEEVVNGKLSKIPDDLAQVRTEVRDAIVAGIPCPDSMWTTTPTNSSFVAMFSCDRARAVSQFAEPTLIFVGLFNQEVKEGSIFMGFQSLTAGAILLQKYRQISGATGDVADKMLPVDNPYLTLPGLNVYCKFPLSDSQKLTSAPNGIQVSAQILDYTGDSLVLQCKA